MFFSTKKIVVTHSGGFHPDDVFAVAALSIFNRAKIKVIRTRDPQKIAKADYVVDVGNVYDYSRNRFDHHQIGGAGERENGVPYAAFGLVWKHYGEKICGGKESADFVDKLLVQFIDTMDNGVGALRAVYAEVQPFTLVDAIMNMNPADAKEKNFDEQFNKAVRLAKEVLTDAIKDGRAKIAARKIVEEAYRGATDKRLIILDVSCSWFEILKNYPEPLYVIEPEYEHEEGERHWKVKCVRDDPNNFVNRKDLPQSWTGKRDTELAVVSGVPDAVFCHNKRFLAIAKSKAGAIALANIALDL